jgi:hypothetical protein
MNKFYRAAGRWTIGIATVTGTMALAADSDSKPLTLALGLKGFYDDNIFTRPSGPDKVDSFGLQVVPGINYKVSNGATTVSVGYTLDAKWYERRSRDSVDSTGKTAQKADPWDYAHYIKASIKHKFSDTISIQADDSFAITREPQEFLSGQVARSKGDAIINYASLKGEVGLTDSFGLAVAYRNNLFDYSDENYKPLLNRMENIPSVDLRYRINPNLFGIIGYRYSDVAYDKHEILPITGSSTVVYSDARNRSSHFVYGGADWQASPVLSFAARAGGEFTEYSNLDKYHLQGNKSDTSPFADVSAKWQFAKDSYLNGGLRHQLNATDALYPSDPVGTKSSSIVLSQESTLLYAVLAHNITPALRVSVNGQFQDSVFNGGTYDGKSEQFYGAGLSLSYALNTYLSAEASYFYDKLATASDPALSGRAYARNRVFLGIRASY